MNASANNRPECRYYLRLDLLRLVKVMLFTFTFIWIVNVIVLVTSPTVSTKSTPCFTDGDCPSALEKCVYGSWKGLGNCHRKTRDTTENLRMVRSDRRGIFRNRRLVRRKRNPSNVWNDSYLSQRRWDIWLAAKQRSKTNAQHSKAASQQSTNERFDEIAADLLSFGRSYITFEGINYTISVIPTKEGASDWLLTLTSDNHDTNTKRIEDASRGHLKTNKGPFLEKHEHASRDDQASVASFLLENSFGNSNTTDAVVNISIRYPVSAISRKRYGGGSDIRFRFRRQLPDRLTDLGPIDPLINHVTHVQPVIPFPEDIFGRNLGKRSIHSKKEMQRIRRELEEIEDDVAPLPKLIKSPDEGPIIIEDLFDDNGRTSTLRKKRQHEVNNKNGLMHARGARHKRHHKTKDNAKTLTNTRSAGHPSRPEQRKERKLPKSASLLGTIRKIRSNYGMKRSRATLRQQVKENTFKRKITKRSHKNAGKTAGGISIDIKGSNKGAIGGNTTLSGTTEPPDPFATLRNTKEPHIDYYDVSKRNPRNDDEDIDPESSLNEEDSESSPDEDDAEIDNVEEETRKKRQTLAEELEDDDEQTIPSWRETVELLRRANTFAVPAHDSTGHVVLVRRVRDLGALDLGESLVKLKETMAKIFGRCSPARRRKRSHPAPTEVVTDRLSNGETWEIQGEGREVVDQAKIDVHMDDDKPYNVTTVLRPMGKRSYNYGRNNQETKALLKTKLHPQTSREMRDILEQNSRLDEIPGLKRLGKRLNDLGLKNGGHITQHTERLAHSKRSEENIPVNKDLHMEAKEGSPVEIDLTVDEQPGGAQPVAEVQSNTLSASKSETALPKRDEHQRSASAGSGSFSNTGQSSTHLMSKNSASSIRGSLSKFRDETSRGKKIHEKCVDCKTMGQSLQNTVRGESNGRKAVREPYVITRKYDDPKRRPSRAESGGRKTRELGTAGGLDGANLLYLADGDPLPSSWRAPLPNIKRDVDVEVEVEDAGNDTDSSTAKEKAITTTAAPPSTILVTIEEEKDEDVFSGNLSAKSGKISSSLEASPSVKSGRKGSNPIGATSIALGGRISSDSPDVINLSLPRPKSVLTVASGGGSSAIEETITSGDRDWGISGSSDRLMALISGIEKALRVPLGGSDSSPDQVTVVDDGSDSVQTQIIGGQPEITEQKTSYMYSVNEPQPPLVVATTTQEKRPDVVKMNINTGASAAATNTRDLNENIYLKGFEVPRKPAKPLFVDAAAKKMIWVEPSYKTVVSSEIPKNKVPLSYVRLFSGAVPRVKPVDQLTQITSVENMNFDTVGDAKIGNGEREQVTVEKVADQPPGSSITDIRASKTTDILQPPRLLGVERDIFLSGQLADNAPPPERDRDMDVKVVSSVRSDDQGSRRALNTSPTVTVHMNGQNDGSGRTNSKQLPSNIRILHDGRNSEGKIVATIGSQNSFKAKKDLQGLSDSSQIPLKRQRLLSSNGVILAKSRLSSGTQNTASVQAQGDKRDVQHVYRTPNAGNKGPAKRRVNVQGASPTSKRANVNRAQPAPVVHTYSKDPGVQGATVGMMSDLASRLASQKAQRRTSQTLSRKNVSCVAGRGKCRRKRRARRVATTSTGNVQDYRMSPKAQQRLKSDVMPNRQVKKRDVSRTVFEQPKVFIVSPKTILEAPGTTYKFIDPQERSNVTKHLRVYTVSNISSNAGDQVPVEKPAANSGSTSDDEQFGHDSASSLPMSHEKALQEAESQERFKIVDSVEGFSMEAPTFDKRVTSGGQISEDRMVPVPLEVAGSELPHDENRISITTDVEQHKHSRGMKISATETSDSGGSPTSQHKTQTVEYVDSAETSPESHEDAAKIVQVVEDDSVSNTRKKKRSPSSGTSNRKTREEKIQDLRKELQNLNNIGSRFGLNFFDKSAIDKIVREVSHRGRKAKLRKRKMTNQIAENTHSKHKRKSLRRHPEAMTDSIVENASRIPLSRGIKSNFRKRRTRLALDINGRPTSLRKTVRSKAFQRQNARSHSHGGLKRNNPKSIPDHNRRRQTLQYRNHNARSKRTMRTSNKRSRNTEIDTGNDSNIDVAPTYHYNNEVHNDYPLVISNPENHDTSNNRQREETLTVSNKESDPMEITTVLRGRRKKRDVKPDEFFRVSREEPFRRRSVESRMVAPLSPELDGQWQKRFALTQLHRDENGGRLNEPTPAVMRRQPSGEPNQRDLGPQKSSRSPKTGSGQQAVSISPQGIDNAGIEKRQRVTKTFSSQRNSGLPGRRTVKEPVLISERSNDKDPTGYILNNGVIKKATNSDSSKPSGTERNDPKEIPSKASNATKQEPQTAPRKSKGPEMGVWKKLGEIFDIGAKETPRPDTEGTVLSASSPPPLPVVVPAAAEGAAPAAAPGPSGRTGERDGRPSSPSVAGEEGAKSGLRAAIVDRLLQDLRRMASARGSEMARAESDLIEILHDYQTDLMDEDEKTVAGEPFQGVRIHDNVAIPVVYQAVPIKTEGLSQHRLVVRSSEHHPSRSGPSGWDDNPYNPP